MKVATYNIWDGGGERLSLIADVIEGMRPDAIALLEANSRANAETLARMLRMNLAYGEANSEFAIAWLSRVPIVTATNHRLPILAKTLFQIDVEWKGSPLSLFATHLAAGITPHDSGRRVREVEGILGVLPRDDSAHLLVGDFNAINPLDRVGTPPPGTPDVEDAAAHFYRPIQLLLDAGYVDTYRTKHPGEDGFTWRADHPWLRLDYVFASRGAASRVAECSVVTGNPAAAASDHFPVIADLLGP